MASEQHGIGEPLAESEAQLRRALPAGTLFEFEPALVVSVLRLPERGRVARVDEDGDAEFARLLRLRSR